MKTKSFRMKLKPGQSEEYKKRHQNLWPELKDLLKSAGISEYSIWLDEDANTLFAIQNLPDDFDNSVLIANPIMKKWWRFMADIMETNDDLSPVAVPLEEMFYLK